MGVASFLGFITTPAPGIPENRTVSDVYAAQLGMGCYSLRGLSAPVITAAGYCIQLLLQVTPGDGRPRCQSA